MNHQTFERTLRLRDMPGGMRDGVLVTPLTPTGLFLLRGGVCASTAFFSSEGVVVALSAALVAPLLIFGLSEAGY